MTNGVETYRAEIFIAGSLEVAKQVCREFCMIGLCVTVDPTTFIYTGGEEAGVRVGLINYPRFPSVPDEIFATAINLADRLRERLCQHSYSIVGTDRTLWRSVRDDGQWEKLEATLGTKPIFPRDRT